MGPQSDVQSSKGGAMPEPVADGIARCVTAFLQLAPPPPGTREVLQRLIMRPDLFLSGMQATNDGGQFASRYTSGAPSPEDSGEGAPGTSPAEIEIQTQSMKRTLENAIQELKRMT